MHKDEKQIIEQITKAVTQMLKGEKAEPIKYEGTFELLAALAESINELIFSISEIWNFILPLSQGMLDIETPRAANILASPLKELHSQLRTLVWQVQQVARGDYRQRVVFMGEFSDAFNTMVEALEEKDRLINEHILYLKNEAERLKESQARYSAAVRNSPGGIYIFDPISMKIIESNQQFNKMMGYTKEEILELSVYDLYADNVIAKKDFEQMLKKSLHSISNRKYRLKNGTYIEVDINSCWSVSGQSNVVIVSVRDVTERNKAQEIAAKYKVLLENARDIMVFIDLDGRIIEANKAAEDSYGYSRDELLSLSIYDLHNKNDRFATEQYMKEASLGGVTFETIQIRKDGTSFLVEASCQGIAIGNQKLIGAVIRDISERKRMEENLRYFASYDALTRVPNRRLLEDTYTEFIQSNPETRSGAVLLIDVDNFKFVNDTYGHTVGDMILVHLVSVLRENLREDEFLARLGSDEFCVLLKNAGVQEAKHTAERLRRAVEQAKFSPGNNGVSFNCTISIGVSSFDNNVFEFREIVARANFALSKSKENGRNRVSCIADHQVEIGRLSETNSLVSMIREALEADRFVLFFQPVVNISSRETIHHEALLRIINEDGEVIYPGKAIPSAERFGFMTQIDRKIVELSFEALERYPDLKLFVNLSGVSIGDEELLSLIEDNIRNRGIDPSRLGFEITETAAVKDFARADRWIRQLREKGCKFALDDFGIGFSSFSYLQYLSVDYVKIDGSYVHDLDRNYRNRALVQAINTVARSFGKEVIAECVENKSILKVLKENQISYAQGFYLGYPEPVPRPGTSPSI